MDLLKNVGVFVGWLSGSLAGVSAFFYAFGYVITLSNLNLLGLEAFLVHYDPAFYIGRGATFFLYLALNVVIVLLALVPVAVLVWLAWLVRGALQRGGPRAENPERPGFIASHRRGLSGLVYILLVLALGGVLYLNFIPLSDILTLSDLLRTDTPDDNPVRDQLLRGDRDALKRHFVLAVGGMLLAAVMVYAVFRLLRSFPFRALALAPFALVLSLYVVVVPLVYGVVSVPAELAEVELHLTPGEADTGARSPLFLLNQTTATFLLWDPTAGAVVWLPARRVQSAMLLGMRSVGDIHAAVRSASGMGSG